MSSRRFRLPALVVSLGLLTVAFAVPGAASALTATTTSITASPSPATAGQSVTLTATTTAPGIVSFSYNGQVVGTAPTAGAAATATGFNSWSYTGNSVASRMAVDNNGNILVATWNPDDCGSYRCQTKQLTSGGINYSPYESWNGPYVMVSGLAGGSDGKIYQAVYNGNAQNTVRVSPSFSAASTTFVSSASICDTCSAGQGYITGMTIDANNNLYITNGREGKILKVTPAGVVTTYASGLGSPIAGPAFNNTTGVLYYIDGNKDIKQIPAGGGTPTLLTAASCSLDTNPASPWYGNGAQLAIDSAGFIYGAQCGGVTPTSTPNASPITQVNPTSGVMREYMSWSTCMNGSLPNWAAGCGGSTALAFIGDKMYTAGASMDRSNVMGMNTSGYVATLTYTPTIPGSFATGASLAPTDSATYAGSTGNGTLVVGPAAPSAPDLAAASDLGTSSTDDITSDNTPLIEVPGTYATGDTITVTATKSGSANVTCSYVIPATGCSLGTLANGTWSITATDTHPTGGTSVASSALSITVDATAPSAPSGVDLATSSDSGSSSTDNATSDTTPTMSASGGSTGDTMTLTATNGTTTISCSYVLPASSCTMPTMTDGTWSVTATLTDPAGNTSTASSALSMTIDSTGPAGLTPDLLAGSDLGSSPTDNVTSDNTPTITIPGQATGDVITITAAKAGSTSVTCTYTVGASTNCTLGTLADGGWTITASVTDLAGNAGTTLSLPITIDTSAPAAPSGVDLAAASDTGSSSTDNITSDNTPTVSASGGTSGDTMTLTATKSGSANVTCTYVLPLTSCDLGTLADGTWNVSATLTDPAGNTSTASSPLSITVDTTAPSAPTAVDLAAASDTGSSPTDNNTNDNTPTVSASGGTSGDTMTLTATKAGSANVSCSYVLPAASCDLGTLTDGTWSITATLTDPAGNTSTASSPLSITVNTSVPTAPTGVDLAASSDTGRSSTDNVTTDTTPTLSAAGGATGETITLTATNGANTVTCFYILPAANCTMAAMADGTWSVTATITNIYGTVSAPSTPLSITIDTSAPSAPTVDLAASSDNGSSSTDNLTNDNTPQMAALNANAGDTITVSATPAGGGSAVTCTYIVGQQAGCDLPTLADGTWNVTMTATDPAGNTSTVSAPLAITIDTVAPTPPSAPTLDPASDTGTPGDGLTSDTTPTLSVTGGTNGDTVTITAVPSNGGTPISCTFVIGQASSCTLPTLPDGAYTVTVSATATDPAGNTSTSSSTLSITVDTMPPTGPATPTLDPTSDTGTSSTDRVTADSTPTMHVPGVPAGETITLNATGPNGQTASCTFVASATVDSCDLGPLTDGSWSISASSNAVDSAGNQAAPSAPVTIDIAATAPTAPARPKPVGDTTTDSSGTAQTMDTTPRFTVPGAAAPNTITLNAVGPGGLTATCSYTPSATVTGCTLGPLADGLWTITPTQTNPAGVVSPAGAPYTIRIGPEPKPNLPPDPYKTDVTRQADGSGYDATAWFAVPVDPSKVDAVIFVITDRNGNVIGRIRKPVTDSMTKATMRIDKLPKGAKVSAYTVNRHGVSPRAPRYANVRHVDTRRNRTALPNGSYRLLGSPLGEDVIFEGASHVLTADAKTELDRLASIAKRKGGQLYITGFARRNGINSDGWLLRLSKRRAEAVATYLADRGVTGWITWNGVGPATQTIGTPENRNVAIRWAPVR